MKKEYTVFLILLSLGVAARIIASSQLDWFLGSNLHVDEITYVKGCSPPFERPPGTYLLAGLPLEVEHLRIVFSTISLIPAIVLFAFRKKKLA